MIEMAKVILKNLTSGLPAQWNCPTGVFDELTINPSAPLRLLHYAPQSIKQANQFGGASIKYDYLWFSRN